jgi:hypothetical protein
MQGGIMSNGYVTLRTFRSTELIFDERETKDILKFFFAHRSSRIEAVECTEALRNFAQGLLIEAVDATYMLGYVEILLRTFYSPNAGLRKALRKLATKSVAHWFKYASRNDLINAKISSRVRDKLALNFSSVFTMMLEGVAANSPPRKFFARVNYGAGSPTDKMWG